MSDDVATAVMPPRPSRRLFVLVAAAAAVGAAAAVSLMPALAGVVGLAAVWALWRWPRGGAITLALASPLYEVAVFRVGTFADLRILEILWAVVVVSLLWRAWRGPSVPFAQPPKEFATGLLVFVGWFVVSATLAGGVRPFVECAQTAYLTVIGWVVAGVAGSLHPRELDRRLRFWAVGFVVLVAVSLGFYVANAPTPPRIVVSIPSMSVSTEHLDSLVQDAGAEETAIARLGILDQTPVGTAALVVAILPVALGLALTKRRESDRWIAAALAAASAAVLLLTYSRAGWVVAVLVVAALLVWTGSRRALLGMGVLTVVVLIVVSLPSVAPRIQELTNPQESSYRSHSRMWVTAIVMANERPFFGWGPGQYTKTAQQLAIDSWVAADITDDQPHDWVLELAAETGWIGALIGVVLVGGLLGVSLKRVWHAPLPWRGVWLAAAAYTVMNLTLNTFRTETMWVWLGLLAAMCSRSWPRLRAEDGELPLDGPSHAAALPDGR